MILTFVSGFCICRKVFGRLFSAMETTFDNRKLRCSSLFLILPASFATGTLAMTWPVYILAYLFRNLSNGLLIANIIVMVSAAAYAAVCILIGMRRRGEKETFGIKDSIILQLSKISTNEIIISATILIFCLFLMYMTCYVTDGKLTVGLSVFGDFSPHIGMIRSFSRGGNLPTRYTVFADNDIKYHFMYEFLVGNLEFLGMRIDHAFNIVSAISLAGAYSMLYSLTVRLCGRKGGGALACLFMMFRSSFTFFVYAASIEEGSVISTLLDNDMFIGSTENETWGLWNVNVFCNQRHLAFAMIVMFMMLHLFLPYLFAAGKRLRIAIVRRREAYSETDYTADVADYSETDYTANVADYCETDYTVDVAECKDGASGTKGRFMEKLTDALDRVMIPMQAFVFDSLFSKEGWRIGKSAVSAVAAGILLGAVGFWNGAVVIMTLIVMFFLAAASDRRLEYLITALIAGALVLVQSKLFMNGSTISPHYQYGFIAQNKTVAGSIVYLLKLTGVLLILMYVIFVIYRGVKRYIIVAFAMPIVFSFTISLTPDINVNHKYIFLAVILLGSIAGGFIAELMAKKKAGVVFSCLLLIFLMTVTGVYDFYTFCRENRKETSISCNLDAPLTQWIMANTNTDDVFLTAPYSFSGGTGSDVVLAGTRMYMAWPYFAWSAGYNTDKRQALVEQLYSASSEEELRWLTGAEEIDYIIIEKANRDAEEYELNEELIANVFPEVYTEGEGEWKVSVYKVGE